MTRLDLLYKRDFRDRVPTFDRDRNFRLVISF
jgi:hypothetical protein